MSKQRFTPEFKAEAIKQITERGYSVKDVSERLGVSDNSLYKWLKEHNQATNPDPAVTQQQDLAAENARLKAALKRAEEERDILKKAAAYFAKQFS
jgi:transposase